MATYFLAIGIDSQSDPQSDGKHLDAEYGFGVDNGDGNGVQPLGPGSGSSGRQFEAVQISPNGGANNSPLTIVVFDNFSSPLSTVSSFLRASFRPSHDTSPSQNVDTSPLAANDTNSLLNGVVLPAASSSIAATTASNYGLPGSTYTHATVLSGYTISGTPNSNSSFELTVEVKAVASDGSIYYFKVDPEMMIDF